MFFAFDVDGTLTPSRERIDPGFESWLLEWITSQQKYNDNRVLLATGSDLAKTIEQLGEDIVKQVDFCCNCLGNSVYHKGKLIHEYKFTPSDGLINFLEEQLANSAYSEKVGNHIENRGAMINFSIVGRAAQGTQRKRYYEWDKLSGERLELAQKINEKFSNEGIAALVGGETGIDIIPVGLDKRQCINLMAGHIVNFFGDRMDDAGNDKPLATEVEMLNNGSKCFEVSGWEETWSILKERFIRV